jgi:diguanylate cyclase (GGDEF)-like protein
MTKDQVDTQMTILIVDDEQATREVLLEFMDVLGYRAVAVDAGEKAVQEVRKNRYDLVLTDLFLPGMDGIDVVREIKAISAETIVIIMTAHGSIQLAIDSIREGAYDFILKPLDIDTIRVRMSKAFEFRSLYNRSQEYEKRATVDGLTGLWNFAHFQKLLAKEIERSRRYTYPVSLVMIDLDNFKRYNDTFGHISGNAVLMQVSKIFSSFIRKADTVSRYGGEEFVIILPHTEKQYAYTLCDRLRKSVEREPFDGEEAMPGGKITISSGVAAFPDDAATAEELIDHADKALYSAKRAGRNMVCTYGE